MFKTKAEISKLYSVASEEAGLAYSGVMKVSPVQIVVTPKNVIKQWAKQATKASPINNFLFDIFLKLFFKVFIIEICLAFFIIFSLYPLNN